MDVREKLVELFYDNNVRCNQKIEDLVNDVIDIITHGVTVSDEIEELRADNNRLRNMWAKAVSDLSKATANGVTVQEWYSADDYPKEDGTYLVQTNTGTITTARFYAFKSFPATKYLPACHRSPSWQSNRNVVKWTFLPQPPKGE